MTKRVFVTGGSGFIGTNLIARLMRNEDVEILNFDLNPPKIGAHGSFWLAGDLRDENRVRHEVSRFSPDEVYHLGARTDLHGQAIADYSANTAGTRHLVRAVNDYVSGARVVYASSRLVCRIGYEPADEADYAPPNAYGESKVAGELIVREEARHPYVIVRPTSIWGPWFGVPYRDFFDSVRGGLFLSIRGVQIPKSFGYVGNTVYQLEQLMSSVEQVEGQTLYLGDYPPVEVNAFAALIRRAFGKPPSRQIPVAALRVAAHLGDVAKTLGWKEARLTSFRLENLLTPMVYDLKPLEAVVGALPYTVEAGVSATVDWIRSDDERRSGNR